MRRRSSFCAIAACMCSRCSVCMTTSAGLIEGLHAMRCLSRLAPPSAHESGRGQSGSAVTTELLHRPHAQNARGLISSVLAAAGIFLRARSARHVTVAAFLRSSTYDARFPHLCLVWTSGQAGVFFVTIGRTACARTACGGRRPRARGPAPHTRRGAAGGGPSDVRGQVLALQGVQRPPPALGYVGPRA
jgi:hypothetical protein